MSIFYQSIDDLFAPLLFFGLLLALLQFGTQRQTMIGRLISALQLVWLILAGMLAIYILVKLATTAIGWILTHFNIADTICGHPIPSIDDKLGIMTIIFFLILLVLLVIIGVKFIKRRRGKKNADSASKKNNG